jgi:hypothetical protein
MALILLGSDMFSQRMRSGEDMGGHSVTVGAKHTRSSIKLTIGLLHDVIENGRFTIQDLREMGFRDKVVEAVDAMTHRAGESYFAYIERIGRNKYAVNRKRVDLHHNMDSSRVVDFWRADDAKSEERMDRENKYIVADLYLSAIEKGEIVPGTPVKTFVASNPELINNKIVQEVLKKHGMQPSEHRSSTGISDSNLKAVNPANGHFNTVVSSPAPSSSSSATEISHNVNPGSLGRGRRG